MTARPRPEVRPPILVYVPHGAIPDRRGFSPAIVACEFARRTRLVRPWLACAAEQDPVGRDTWEGLPVARLGRRRFYTRLRKLGLRPPGWTLAADFLALCREIAPALLHVHQLEFDVYELGRRFRDIPTIVHAHVLTHPASPGRGRAAFYVAVSDHVARGLADLGYPAERTVTIRNGVDTQLFAPADAQRAARAKERLGLAPGTPVLAFVGRKHDVKGYPAFLAVAERLLAHMDSLMVLAIGADPERPSGEAGFTRSREREHRLMATGRFRSLPALRQIDLARAYDAIDVTLLPSLAEPQGMVMIESLSAGCVTISSRVGGISETIMDGVTGLLVDDPRDVDALYERAAAVLARLPDHATMRAAARAYAVQYLDWAVSAARLDDLYKTVVSGIQDVPPGFAAGDGI